MPGRLFLTTPFDQIARTLGVPAPAPQPQRLNMAPGEEVMVLTAEGFFPRRWGIIPVGRVNARGRPVMETIVNARGETVFDKSAFSGTGRGVVPVDGWYEWTGEQRKKTAWRIRRGDGAPLLFAAITDVWRAPGGRELPQVATVTCEPNADVAKVHDRMGVLLDPADVPRWLTGSKDEARALIRPLAEGLLDIGPATDVDWTRP